MSETTTAPIVIEGIDLDGAIPCGHGQHRERHAQEDAAYIVRYSHDCGLSVHYPLCRYGWERLSETLHCPATAGGCGANGVPRWLHLVIVETL